MRNAHGLPRWPACLLLALAVSCGDSGVTVEVAQVDQVMMSPPQLTLRVEDRGTLVATPMSSAGQALQGRSVVWSTDNASIATVAPTGEVTAVGPGTVTIRATIEGRVGTSAVTVQPIPVGRVEVTPATASLEVGQSTQLTATPRSASGTALSGRTITWSSSNPSIATVTGAGLVSAVAPGTATITAMSEGQSGTASLTIIPIPVASVLVAPDSASVMVGETIQLTATPRSADGSALTGRAVTWSSSNPSIATVTGTGLVSAVAPGTATITAMSEGQSGTAALTIIPIPVASVLVAPDSASVMVGETTQLTATPRSADGSALTGRTITWSSSNPSIATVTGAGLVSAVAPGTATITAMSEGQSGTASLTITPIPVASVSVAPDTASLTVGETTQLTATPRSANGTALTGRAVTWSSLNPSIATVTGTGLVSAVAPGMVTITATSEGRSGTASLTITPIPVASVSVAPDTASLTVGETTQLTATARSADGTALTGRPVTWSSSNPSIATVTGAGLVSAVAPGMVTITATSEGQSGTASLTIIPIPVASVLMVPDGAVLVIGESTRLTATPIGADGRALVGRAVTWRSSNPTVATVTETGLVSAVSVGEATITATSEEKSASATIVVQPAPVPVANVRVSPEVLSVAQGEVVQFVATVFDGAGNVLTDRWVAWSTSNPSTAAVTSEGVVTALAPGSATISAMSEGQTGAATVTVDVAPPTVASITLSPSDVALQVGQSVQIVATPRAANGEVLTGRVITWRTSNLSTAAVTSEGVVTALAPGSATISATSEGQTGAATVTVDVAPPTVASITLSPSDVSLQVGQSVQIVATPRAANGEVLTGRVITWSTSNPSTVAVTSEGVVTALAPGSATISATSEGHSGTAQVLVEGASSSNFALAENGVTVICTNAAIGETGTINGVTYTKRSEQQIRDLVAAGNYALLPTTCTSGITSMETMFQGREDFNEDIGSWDVSSVQDMSDMFNGALRFNQPIGAWNVSTVTDMSGMLYFTRAFTQDISGWDVSSVRDMDWMFASSVFNQPIGAWDVSSVRSMRNMFRDTYFNQPIGDWNVSAVESMHLTFHGAYEFNQDISRWDVSSVTDMHGMFNAPKFNQDLSVWDVSSVTDMSSMFGGAASFNQPIGDWNVSSVMNMQGMFQDAVAFDQDLSGWNVTSATNMDYMFKNASRFNQGLSSWCVTNINSKPTDFDSGASSWTLPRPAWGTCPSTATPVPVATVVVAQEAPTVTVGGSVQMSGSARDVGATFSPGAPLHGPTQIMRWPPSLTPGSAPGDVRALSPSPPPARGKRGRLL
jgi:trimeric autotransporter adhesin